MINDLPYRQQLSQLGIPAVCLNKPIMRVVTGMEEDSDIPKAILTINVLDKNYTYNSIKNNMEELLKNGKLVDDVYVENDWTSCINIHSETIYPDIEFNTIDDYLNLSIINKDVYASVDQYPAHFLPTGTIPFLVVDKDEPKSEYINENFLYSKVNFVEETKVIDLYRNAWKYKYDITQNRFIRLGDTDAINNAFSIYMLKSAFIYGGTAMDRVADLSRIILFLLSKVNLTAEEQETLAPLLQYTCTAEQIESVAKREAMIQKYVRFIKTHTMEFLSRAYNIAEELVGGE